ncbi:hypothetical protein BC628DRAFT_1398157 [Trametes gibbosa]|nr:hypothetical protein BC628DRAFT_1398157 [Trametes gibbosa]
MAPLATCTRDPSRTDAPPRASARTRRRRPARTGTTQKAGPTTKKGRQVKPRATMHDARPYRMSMSLASAAPRREADPTHPFPPTRGISWRAAESGVFRLSRPRHIASLVIRVRSSPPGAHHEYSALRPGRGAPALDEAGHDRGNAFGDGGLGMRETTATVLYIQARSSQLGMRGRRTADRRRRAHRRASRLASRGIRSSTCIARQSPPRAQLSRPSCSSSTAPALQIRTWMGGENAWRRRGLTDPSPSHGPPEFLPWPSLPQATHLGDVRQQRRHRAHTNRIGQDTELACTSGVQSGSTDAGALEASWTEAVRGDAPSAVAHGPR